MMPIQRLAALAALALPLSAADPAGNALDSLVLGDGASETAHGFATTGSAVFRDELTLHGPGDIWERQDTLVFRWQKLTGDGWIEALVTSAGDASGWTKVGVMMRESLEPGAKNAFMFDSNDHGLHAQWRTDSGGGTGQSEELALPDAPPYRVRAERKGDTFILSASAAGKPWQIAKTQVVPMGREIYMGLVNSSGGKETTNRAIYDRIGSSVADGMWTDTLVGTSAETSGSAAIGLGEPARRMLPAEPAGYYGGEMTFRMKVDPERQNYLTARLWGSDGSGSMDRVILEVEGKEVGMRHGGGLDIFIHNVGAVSPGAFWYRTTPLPLWLTRGKSEVGIRLRSVGSLFAYGTPWKYETYQQKLTQPGRGIYRLHTHTDPMFRPGGEKQGATPSYAAAPKRPPVDVAAYFEEFKAARNKEFAALLAKPEPTQQDAAALAQAVQVKWTVAYRNRDAAVLTVKALDALCRKFHADNKLAAAEWGGNFGPAGYALSVVAPAISRELDEKADLGNGPRTRREQYAAMLRASVDAGRLHRQTITNQAIINAFNIYRANRGLLALKAEQALPEERALRYYREACGMEEWHGDDPPKGDGPGKPPFPGLLMMTAKGTSREWNWCCANCYGRMDPYVFEMYRLTGDIAFRDRALVISAAHNRMLYPSVDGSGYRAMLNEGVICTRNVYHPGHTYYGYADIAASLADRAVTGGAAQGIADGQFLESWQIGEASVFLPDDYAAITAALGKTGSLPPLPATPGQPDFAWADEQNAVLSIKHGDDMHFLTFARRSEGGLSKIGDAHSITPRFERVVQFALEDVRFETTGEFATVGSQVQSDFTGKPPDNPVSAFAGQKFPKLTGRPGSPADFYGVRYGDFLIGMNCSADKTFRYEPAGFAGGVDRVSGKKMTAPVQVPPQTTVVFLSPEAGR